jgi:hypothetical protein
MIPAASSGACRSAAGADDTARRGDHESGPFSPSRPLQRLALFLPAARRRLNTAIDLLTLAFCSLMAWLGIEAVPFADMLDERSASTLQAPRAWALHLALPVGMVLIVVRLVGVLASSRQEQ